jgi:hypothetical protein|tara:strand:+ start:125 stop:547 length:423 start_codon:yes stop_codon:yes gene_type:complete
MAVEFSRTTGAGGVMAVDFEIDMYAGALESGTRWLDGAAGAADAYPGSITGFQATNDDTTNTAGRGLKMVMGVLTLVQNANVFTVGGDADTIHAMVIGGSGVAGKSLTCTTNFTTGGSATATMLAEGTLDNRTLFMAIVS